MHFRSGFLKFLPEVLSMGEFGQKSSAPSVVDKATSSPRGKAERGIPELGKRARSLRSERGTTEPLARLQGTRSATSP